MVKAKVTAHRYSDNYYEARYTKDDWEDISNIVDMWQDCRILAEQEEFDEEFSAMCELPSLAARRAEAKKLAKKLVTKHENIMRWSDEIGVDDLVAGHRADQIVALTLRGFDTTSKQFEASAKFLLGLIEVGYIPDNNEIARRLNVPLGYVERCLEHQTVSQFARQHARMRKQHLDSQK